MGEVRSSSVAGCPWILNAVNQTYNQAMSELLMCHVPHPACPLLDAGVLLVLAMLVMSDFSAVAAVSLSNVAIFASSIASLAFNIPRRRPTDARHDPAQRPGPLIDWDLVLLFGPPTVAGSLGGSYINIITPGW